MTPQDDNDSGPRPLDATSTIAELLEHQLGYEVDAAEMSKWEEMLAHGLADYRMLYPDRFKRRVRRGIPQCHRWQVWKEMLNIDIETVARDYHLLCDKPNQWTSQIEMDTPRTFPSLHCFGENEQKTLRRVLNAYAASNIHLGYCQGMNYVAGLLLIISEMREEECFAVLGCIMEDDRFRLAGFYRDKLPLLQRYLRACDKLVNASVPDLRDHFIKENVQPAVYLHQWFLTLFINCFPLSMVAVIWDVIISEGLPVILKVAVSILQVLKESLLQMQIEDIVRFFKKMKTYDDDAGGDMGAYKVGQLLVKHTEHVVIPERTLEYLNRALDDRVDEDFDLDEDGLEGNNTWFQGIFKMFGGNTQRRGSPNTGNTTSSSRGPWPSSSSPPTPTPPPAAVDVPGMDEEPPAPKLVQSVVATSRATTGPGSNHHYNYRPQLPQRSIPVEPIFQSTTPCGVSDDGRRGGCDDDSSAEDRRQWEFL